MAEGNFYGKARISYLKKREAQEFHPHNEESSNIFDGSQSFPKIPKPKVVRPVQPAQPNQYFLPFEVEPVSG